jgi:hypothetical protein
LRNDFGVFILTHGRPNNIPTLKSLERGNYTGKVFIIIDNEDKEAEEYKRLYGDKVIMFDKLEVSKTFDTADNFKDRRTIVYARNSCWDIAEKLGLKYFLQLDDDYTRFYFKWIKNGKTLSDVRCKQLDRLFEAMITFLDKTNALTVALAQGGDYIGGADSGMLEKGIKRKAMNTLFCRTDRRFQFLGRINEDVNTYVTLGRQGHLFFTVTRAGIQQKATQSNKGGMSDVYLDSGTYLKSFYSVIFSPSCVKIGRMGNIFKRIHHKIAWNNCTPMIISDFYKKRKGERYSATN